MISGALNWATAGFFIWFIVVSTTTYVIWLRPQSYFSELADGNKVSVTYLYLYGLLAAFSAVLFFMTCFSMGVLFTAIEAEGWI